mmetsp:Transcript_12320/g.16926  ORF Transcript_12320/g.16926 Transcript_12320/m.16926 type:complete len:88 (-) Transcript_12320:2258-2521(-)
MTRFLIMTFEANESYPLSHLNFVLWRRIGRHTSIHSLCNDFQSISFDLLCNIMIRKEKNKELMKRYRVVKVPVNLMKYLPHFLPAER